MLGTGITGILGVAFWALAARTYPTQVVGLNFAVISAMALVSGACSLGLGAVLVRYLPVAGRASGPLVIRSYAITGLMTLVVAVAAALTSPIWSPKLGFLSSGAWFAGFILACTATTIFTLQDSVLTGFRAAEWIPLENSLFSLSKLILLAAVVGAFPDSGPFVAWSAPLLIAVVIVNAFIFRRLMPAPRGESTLDRRQVAGTTAGNYAGMLFDLAATYYLPIMVANYTSATEAAYFYVPWLIAVALRLVAFSMMTSLTVEAAIDMPRLRTLSRRALRQTLLLVAPLAALVGIAAPWVLQLFGGAYADAGDSLMRILAVGQIPGVIIALGLAVARIQHRGGVVVAVLAAEAILVIGLSALLLPVHGIDAVGFSWTVTQAVIAIVLVAGMLRPLLLPERRSAYAAHDTP